MKCIKHIIITTLSFFCIFISFGGNVFTAERPTLVGVLTKCRAINADMKYLCDDFSPEKMTAYNKNLEMLKGQYVSIIYLLDESNRYSDDKNYAAPMSEIKAQWAAAFLHAWAIFTLRAKELNTEDSTELFDNLLSDLLTIYGQISGSVGKNDTSPLITCLPPDEKGGIGLRHNDLLSTKILKEKIPSTRELVGMASDEIENNGIYTTLWTIVNVQNDQRDNQTDGVFDWLTKVTSPEYPLYEFTTSATPEIEAFQNRLVKLKKYYFFRHWITDEGKLEQLLEYIKTKVAEGQTDFSVEQVEPHQEVSQPFNELIQATIPDEQGGFFPDAAIWLRYILLASYQGLGGDCILNGVIINNKKTTLKDIFLLNAKQSLFFEENLNNQENARVAPRWNQYPAQGAFNRLVSDTSCGFIEMVAFQLNKNEKLEDYQKVRDARIWNVEDCEFTKQAELKEIARIKLDYSDFTQMSENLCNFRQAQSQISELIEKNKQFDRFYNPEQQFKQLAAACPELAGCSPFSLPNQTYSQYREQLEKALEDLDEYLKKQSYWQEVKQDYVTKRLDRYSLQMESIASKLLLQAAELATQQAAFELIIAENNVKAAGIRELATGYTKAACEDTIKANELKKDFANKQRAFAEGLVKGTKDGMEEMRKKIDEAKTELEKLQQLLNDNADRWQREIEEAERKAGVLSVVKCCVRVIGAVASIYSAGAGSVAAEAICAGINAGCNAAMQAIQIYEGVEFGGMSKDDAWIYGVAATAGTIDTAYSAYSTYRDVIKANKETLVRIDKEEKIRQRTDQFKEDMQKYEPPEMQKLRTAYESDIKNISGVDETSQNSKLEVEFNKDAVLGRWKTDLNKVALDAGKTFVDQGTQLYSRIKNDNQGKKQIVSNARQMCWNDISNDISLAIADWCNPNSLNNDYVSGPVFESDELTEKLWNVLQSGGIMIFAYDTPKVDAILNDRGILPSNRKTEFTENLEHLFIQTNFSQEQQTTANELHYKIDDYDKSINELKELLQKSPSAHNEFWGKVFYGTSFYSFIDKNGNKRIILLNSSTERYMAGWKTGYEETALPILNDIELYRKRLENEANRAENPNGLREVANTIPTIVAGLEQSLTMLNDKLAEALRNYEDKELQSKIEENLFFAAINDLRAAEANMKEAVLNVETAELQRQRAELHIEETNARLNAEIYNDAAKQAQLASTEYQLRNAFRKYAISGQPMVEEPKPITLAGAITVDLSAIKMKKDDEGKLICDENSISVPEVLMGEICRNYCGLLQWLNLFDAKEQMANKHFEYLLKLLEERKDNDLSKTIGGIKNLMDGIQKQIENSVNKGIVETYIIPKQINENWVWIKPYPNSQISDFSDDPDFVEWFQSVKGQESLPIARIDFYITSDADTQGKICHATGDTTDDQFAWDHPVYHYIELVDSHLNKKADLKYSLKVPTNNRTRTNGGVISKVCSFTDPELIVSPDTDAPKYKTRDRFLEGIKTEHNIYGLCGSWRFYIFSTNARVPLDKRIEEIKAMTVRIPVLRVKP